MAKFRVTAPDGGTYEITAPDGASEQDVMSFVQSQMGGNDFASRASSMDPTSLSVARGKNDPFGEYLRNQAMQPREGETEDQRFQYVPPAGAVMRNFAIYSTLWIDQPLPAGAG